MAVASTTPQSLIDTVPSAQRHVGGMESVRSSLSSLPISVGQNSKPKLPFKWKLTMAILTCFCTFGNHWSNGLIVALKTTIIKHLKINNSEFATLVAVTNLVNVFLCVCIGLSIDKWGGPLLSVILAAFHLFGALIMAGSVTNHLNSYHLLVLGKVIAAVGDGSLDNAQHRIFSTYFAPGKGFAFSIGTIWSMANLAQFTGQSTANIIARDLGNYAWALWISAAISVLSLICALTVLCLDKFLRTRYVITDKTEIGTAGVSSFKQGAFKQFSMTFWIVVFFSVFENAGVQSFVSISTQFVQQRLKKGAVVGGWVSSFYLLLPVAITPFLGIFIDAFGHRLSILFLSGLFFLVSMLLLKFSHKISTFVAAYVFYALSQGVTPAPQVEIIRNIIPDPKYYATGFSIKKSVVQASIIIITTAAGRLQDLSHSSLDPAVTIWLAYAAVSVLISGTLLVLSYTPVGQELLPAARLAQVAPHMLGAEVDRLWEKKTPGIPSGSELTVEEKERFLKLPRSGYPFFERYGKWVFPLCIVAIILIGWIMFALGVLWGVHGSVIAGTIGE